MDGGTPLCLGSEALERASESIPESCLGVGQGGWGKTTWIFAAATDCESASSSATFEVLVPFGSVKLSSVPGPAPSGTRSSTLTGGGRGGTSP